MSGPPAPRSVTACAVVVPAHNEAASLPATLRTVRAAAKHPALAGVRVLVVVTADDCRDDTAGAARRGGAQVVEVAHRNVGAARAAAADAALVLLGAEPGSAGREHTGTAGIWLATTDADTLVPQNWLAHQLRQARRGWDCVVGTVRVAPHPTLGAVTVARHDARYFAGRPVGAAWAHPHVHGANLGVAASAYLRAGGFPALPHSEDHALVAALERTGSTILRTDACPVLTSGRADFRAPYGFGALLGKLAAQEPT